MSFAEDIKRLALEYANSKPPHFARDAHGGNATPGSLPKQAKANDLADTLTTVVATEQRDAMAHFAEPQMAAERIRNMPQDDDLNGAMASKLCDFSGPTSIEQRQPKGAVMPNT